jgi:subtilisin family serine protease
MSSWISLMLMSTFAQAMPYFLEKEHVKELLKKEDSKLLWHQWFPTVGLHKHSQCASQQLTLRELATRKGKGVHVVFIDTGVAAFKDKRLPYHADLDHCAQYQQVQNNLMRPHTLPNVTLHQGRLAYVAGHGTHLMGIVAARGCVFTGFAPEARCTMIKAFNDDGTTTLTLFIKALERAIYLKADILNLSLKIDALYIDATAKKRIEDLLAKIPYVVAAAGNNNEGNKCYPACLQGVDFVVGAFDYNHVTGSCSIAEFCTIANPRVICMPGNDIMSTGLAPGRTDGVYVVMSGTSCAAACMTGFLALLLGEIGTKHDKNAVKELIHSNMITINGTSIKTIDMCAIFLKIKKRVKLSCIS